MDELDPENNPENQDSNPEPQKSDFWPLIPKLISLPPIFHSLESDGPFQECLLCKKSLASVASTYMVERIFRGTEPIVEYAICTDCQHKNSDELSDSSRQAMMELFGSIDQEARLQQLRERLEDGKEDAWIDTCVLTGKPRSECKGFHVIAKCTGFDLELGFMPFMLSDDAIKQITALMSAQTRKQMDDFMDNFSMPPEFAEDPDLVPLFL